MALSGGTPERLLLVEGPDDEHVVTHLCERSSLARNFEIVQKGGFSELAKSIPVELKAPGRSALGVVADANNDFDSRWRAVRNRFEQEGMALPSRAAQGGVVVEGRPRVGVWLMPDNQRPGQLEDLVAALVPEGDVVWPLAQKFIEDVPEDVKPKSIIKAQVHAWLAVRADARHMGSAIGTGHLNASASAAVSFAAWLKHLFQAPTLDDI